MKMPSFRKKMEEARAKMKSWNKDSEWRCKDRGNRKGKVVGRVSLLSKYKTSSQKTNTEYSLLDSAASVHVFHTQQQLINFQKSFCAKGEGLFCGTSFVPIKSWGDVSLPLRIRNQTRLLVLKKTALISDFPLNLISLACLEDQGYNWSHRLGEIWRRARIIGTTVRNGNNFEIGQTRRILGTALSTLTTKKRT